MTTESTTLSNADFNLQFVGDAQVGKTSLMLRWAEDYFSTSYIMTICLDAKARHVDVKGKQLKLAIYDLSGVSNWDYMTDKHYSKSDAFCVVFDVTNAESFTNVGKWVAKIKNLAGENSSILLIGNKADSAANRTVTHDQASTYAAANNLPYIETSAQAPTNVHEAIHRIVALKLNL